MHGEILLLSSIPTIFVYTNAATHVNEDFIQTLVQTELVHINGKKNKKDVKGSDWVGITKCVGNSISDSSPTYTSLVIWTECKIFDSSCLARQCFDSSWNVMFTEPDYK